MRIPEWSPDLALAMMDRHGIAATVTSLSVPGTNLGDDAKAREVARACNDEAAEMGVKQPRLGAFATLMRTFAVGHASRFVSSSLSLDDLARIALHGALRKDTACSPA